MGFLEVTTRDGRVSTIELENREMKLGRAATSDVALEKESALEPEHILFAPRKNNCWVSVVDTARVPLLVRGVAHSSGMLPWGTAMTLGDIQLRLLETAPGAEEKKEKASPVVVLGSIGIAIASFFAFRPSADRIDIDSQAPVAPVVLFAEQAPNCRREGEQQRSEATLLGAQAYAKSERYPFDASDGVESVALFQAAAACFTGANDRESATRMTQEGNYMRQRIQDDYRAHQFRLQRAVEQNRFNDALHETRALLALTNDFGEHAYTRWLSRTERQILLALPENGGR